MAPERRDWLLFTGWALTGAGYLLALLSILSIGILILPIPVIATVLLARRRDAGRGLSGLVSSASPPLFLLAYLNRHGPGTYCTTTRSGGSCTDGLLDPRILLALGVLALVGGIALFLVTRRRTALRVAPSRFP
ncbi:hypothetical protein AB0912_33450 [Streptomyces sp. NPDC007084]|uniref:hypothetical protein n=1 Tax=Streptomyces sp. NPDC007084 TaxID=3154313 RepID=UPI00345508D9